MIKRGFFQRDSPSFLLFVISNFLQSYAKSTRSRNLIKNVARFNHLFYIDDFQQFTKTESKMQMLDYSVQMCNKDANME